MELKLAVIIEKKTPGETECNEGYVGNLGHCVIPEKFTKIDSGLGHSCGFLEDATVKCWGLNFYGQLADNVKLQGIYLGGIALMINYSDIPVEIPGVSDAVDLYSGTRMSCAKLTDLSIKCWGI